MATYPNAVDTTATLPNKSAGDVVQSSNVNLAYAEIIAITNAVGTTPGTSGPWGSSGTFTTGTTVWGSLNARVQNIENGLYSINSAYVSKNGGSVILPSSGNSIGLVIQAQNPQSVSLQEWQANGGTPVASISAAGAFKALSIDGGTA